MKEEKRGPGDNAGSCDHQRTHHRHRTSVCLSKTRQKCQLSVPQITKPKLKTSDQKRRTAVCKSCLPLETLASQKRENLALVVASLTRGGNVQLAAITLYKKKTSKTTCRPTTLVISRRSELTVSLPLSSALLTLGKEKTKVERKKKD